DAKGKGEWSQGIANQEGNENISSGQVGGVQTAEVLVDTETGVVKVVHMVAVQDCGLVVNKLACESQVAGGVIMGLNYALFEEIIRDRETGRQVNPDMEFYKLGGRGHRQRGVQRHRGARPVHPAAPQARPGRHREGRGQVKNFTYHQPTT